jgi:hypothetical protein
MSTNSKSKSNFLSRGSRWLHSAFRSPAVLACGLLGWLHPAFRSPAVYACGLLGTYSVGANGSDKWMATDFVALRQLIGARDDLSAWYCGTSIREAGDFLLGDSGCDRIAFNPPPFETVCLGPPVDLFVEFLLKVKELSSELSRGDILYLVLAGHGSEATGSFVVGDLGEGGADVELKKEMLEKAVEGTKGTVKLINTACFSGRWKSSHWQLAVAAGANQHAVSIVESGSGQCRGGFFTNSLVAEHAYRFGIDAPCSGSLDDDGNRGQRVHHFDPEKATIPSSIPIERSLQSISDWIRQWRNHFGRTYTCADISFFPCTNDMSHSLPFLPLNSPNATIYRLSWVPPSPAPDHATSLTARNPPQRQVPNQPLTTTLSTSDRDELATQALDLLRFRPINTAKETGTILKCWQVVYGVKPLDDVEGGKLLLRLRNRASQMELGLGVAKCLGWTKVVEELGGPKGEQLPMFSLQKEAEESGCLVKTLILFETQRITWIAVASWLARVWEASGRPIVERGDWDSAMQQSLPK